MRRIHIENDISWIFFQCILVFYCTFGQLFSEVEASPNPESDTELGNKILNPTWIDLGKAILATSAVGAIIAAAANYFAKKRDEYVEIAKHKIDMMTERKPYLLELSRSYLFIGRTLSKAEKNNTDLLVCIFYISKVLHFRKALYLKYGFQLGNMDAENIIYEIGENTLIQLTKTFDHKDIDLLASYGHRDLSFSNFQIDIMDHHPHIITKFLANISNQNTQEALIETKKNCERYNQLMTLEINHIYKLWYKQKPNLKVYASEDTIKFLKGKNSSYYLHLCSTGQKLKYLADVCTGDKEN